MPRMAPSVRKENENASKGYIKKGREDENALKGYIKGLMP